MHSRISARYVILFHIWFLLCICFAYTYAYASYCAYIRVLWQPLASYLMLEFSISYSCWIYHPSLHVFLLCICMCFVCVFRVHMSTFSHMHMFTLHIYIANVMAVSYLVLYARVSPQHLLFLFGMSLLCLLFRLGFCNGTRQFTVDGCKVTSPCLIHVLAFQLNRIHWYSLIDICI
jgi:hypothetical protein